MQLCRAVATNPHIVVTDFEADLPSPYTVSTLAFLKARSPLVRFVWIMGADNLATSTAGSAGAIFHHGAGRGGGPPGWRLKALASKAARSFERARKPEADAANLPQIPPPAWTFLTGPLSHASSTAIRNRAKAAATQFVARRAQARDDLPWRSRRPRPPNHPMARLAGVQCTVADASSRSCHAGQAPE
jgi:nicotinate-nucleotide adenylyltransferase